MGGSDRQGDYVPGGRGWGGKTAYSPHVYFKQIGVGGRLALLYLIADTERKQIFLFTEFVSLLFDK